MNVILREDAEPTSADIIAKEEEYTNYINHHIALVQKAYKELFVDNPDVHIDDYDDNVVRHEIENLAPVIANHDASKFSDEEFYGYRERFYPTEFEKEHMDSDPEYAAYVKDKMEEAWLHHHKVNDHHPFYWQWENGDFSKDNEPRDMSLGAIIHMICDWQAMSWNFGGTVVSWYDNDADKEKAAMSPRTKSIVEEFLHTLYGYDSKSEV